MARRAQTSKRLLPFDASRNECLQENEAWEKRCGDVGDSSYSTPSDDTRNLETKRPLDRSSGAMKQNQILRRRLLPSDTSGDDSVQEYKKSGKWWEVLDEGSDPCPMNSDSKCSLRESKSFMSQRASSSGFSCSDFSMESKEVSRMVPFRKPKKVLVSPRQYNMAISNETTVTNERTLHRTMDPNVSSFKVDSSLDDISRNEHSENINPLFHRRPKRKIEHGGSFSRVLSNMTHLVSHTSVTDAVYEQVDKNSCDVISEVACDIYQSAEYEGPATATYCKQTMERNGATTTYVTISEVKERVQIQNRSCRVPNKKYNSPFDMSEAVTDLSVNSDCVFVQHVDSPARQSSTFIPSGSVKKERMLQDTNDLDILIETQNPSESYSDAEVEDISDLLNRSGPIERKKCRRGGERGENKQLLAICASEFEEILGEQPNNYEKSPPSSLDKNDIDQTSSFSGSSGFERSGKKKSGERITQNVDLPREHVERSFERSGKKYRHGRGSGGSKNSSSLSASEFEKIVGEEPPNYYDRRPLSSLEDRGLNQKSSLSLSESLERSGKKKSGRKIKKKSHGSYSSKEQGDRSFGTNNSGSFNENTKLDIPDYPYFTSKRKRGKTEQKIPINPGIFDNAFDLESTAGSHCSPGKNISINSGSSYNSEANDSKRSRKKLSFMNKMATHGSVAASGSDPMEQRAKNLQQGSNSSKSDLAEIQSLERSPALQKKKRKTLVPISSNIFDDVLNSDSVIDNHESHNADDDHSGEPNENNCLSDENIIEERFSNDFLPHEDYVCGQLESQNSGRKVLGSGKKKSSCNNSLRSVKSLELDVKLNSPFLNKSRRSCKEVSISSSQFMEALDSDSKSRNASDKAASHKFSVEDVPSFKNDSRERSIRSIKSTSLDEISSFEIDDTNAPRRNPLFERKQKKILAPSQYAAELVQALNSKGKELLEKDGSQELRDEEELCDRKSLPRARSGVNASFNNSESCRRPNTSYEKELLQDSKGESNSECHSVASDIFDEMQLSPIIKRRVGKKSNLSINSSEFAGALDSERKSDSVGHLVDQCGQSIFKAKHGGMKDGVSSMKIVPSGESEYSGRETSIGSAGKDKSQSLDEVISIDFDDVNKLVTRRKKRGNKISLPFHTYENAEAHPEDSHPEGSPCEASPPEDTPPEASPPRDCLPEGHLPEASNPEFCLPENNPIAAVRGSEDDPVCNMEKASSRRRSVDAKAEKNVSSVKSRVSESSAENARLSDREVEKGEKSFENVPSDAKSRKFSSSTSVMNDESLSVADFSLANKENAALLQRHRGKKIALPINSSVFAGVLGSDLESDNSSVCPSEGEVGNREAPANEMRIIGHENISVDVNALMAGRAVAKGMTVSCDKGDASINVQVNENVGKEENVEYVGPYSKSSKFQLTTYSVNDDNFSCIEKSTLSIRKEPIFLRNNREKKALSINSMVFAGVLDSVADSDSSSSSTCTSEVIIGSKVGECGKDKEYIKAFDSGDEKQNSNGVSEIPVQSQGSGAVICNEDNAVAITREEEEEKNSSLLSINETAVGFVSDQKLGRNDSIKANSDGGSLPVDGKSSIENSNAPILQRNRSPSMPINVSVFAGALGSDLDSNSSSVSCPSEVNVGSKEEECGKDNAIIKSVTSVDRKPIFEGVSQNPAVIQSSRVLNCGEINAVEIPQKVEEEKYISLLKTKEIAIVTDSDIKHKRKDSPVADDDDDESLAVAVKSSIENPNVHVFHRRGIKKAPLPINSSVFVDALGSDMDSDSSIATCPSNAVGSKVEECGKGNARTKAITSTDGDPKRSGLSGSPISSKGGSSVGLGEEKVNQIPSKEENNPSVPILKRNRGKKAPLTINSSVFVDALDSDSSIATCPSNAVGSKVEECGKGDARTKAITSTDGDPKRSGLSGSPISSKGGSSVGLGEEKVNQIPSKEENNPSVPISQRNRGKKAPLTINSSVFVDALDSDSSIATCPSNAVVSKVEEGGKGNAGTKAITSTGGDPKRSGLSGSPISSKGGSSVGLGEEKVNQIPSKEENNPSVPILQRNRGKKAKLPVNSSLFAGALGNDLESDTSSIVCPPECVQVGEDDSLLPEGELYKANLGGGYFESTRGFIVLDAKSPFSRINKDFGDLSCILTESTIEKNPLEEVGNVIPSVRDNCSPLKAPMAVVDIEVVSQGNLSEALAIIPPPLSSTLVTSALGRPQDVHLSGQSLNTETMGHQGEAVGTVAISRDVPSQQKCMNTPTDELLLQPSEVVPVSKVDSSAGKFRISTENEAVQPFPTLMSPQKEGSPSHEKPSPEPPAVINDPKWLIDRNTKRSSEVKEALRSLSTTPKTDSSPPKKSLPSPPVVLPAPEEGSTCRNLRSGSGVNKALQPASIVEIELKEVSSLPSKMVTEPPGGVTHSPKMASRGRHSLRNGPRHVSAIPKPIVPLGSKKGAVSTRSDVPSESHGPSIPKETKLPLPLTGTLPSVKRKTSDISSKSHVVSDCEHASSSGEDDVLPSRMESHPVITKSSAMEKRSTSPGQVTSSAPKSPIIATNGKISPNISNEGQMNEKATVNEATFVKDAADNSHKVNCIINQTFTITDSKSEHGVPLIPSSYNLNETFIKACSFKHILAPIIDDSSSAVTSNVSDHVGKIVVPGKEGESRTSFNQVSGPKPEVLAPFSPNEISSPKGLPESVPIESILQKFIKEDELSAQAKISLLKSGNSVPDPSVHIDSLDLAKSLSDGGPISETQNSQLRMAAIQVSPASSPTQSKTQDVPPKCEIISQSARELFVQIEPDQNSSKSMVVSERSTDGLHKFNHSNAVVADQPSPYTSSPQKESSSSLNADKDKTTHASEPIVGTYEHSFDDASATKSVIGGGSAVPYQVCVSDPEKGNAGQEKEVDGLPSVVSLADANFKLLPPVSVEESNNIYVETSSVQPDPEPNHEECVLAKNIINEPIESEINKSSFNSTSPKLVLTNFDTLEEAIIEDIRGHQVSAMENISNFNSLMKDTTRDKSVDTGNVTGNLEPLSVHNTPSPLNPCKSNYIHEEAYPFQCEPEHNQEVRMLGNNITSEPMESENNNSGFNSAVPEFVEMKIETPAQATIKDICGQQVSNLENVSNLHSLAKDTTRDKSENFLSSTKIVEVSSFGGSSNRVSFPNKLLPSHSYKSSFKYSNLTIDSELLMLSPLNLKLQSSVSSGPSTSSSAMYSEQFTESEFSGNAPEVPTKSKSQELEHSCLTRAVTPLQNSGPVNSSKKSAESVKASRSVTFASISTEGLNNQSSRPIFSVDKSAEVQNETSSQEDSSSHQKQLAMISGVKEAWTESTQKRNLWITSHGEESGPVSVASSGERSLSYPYGRLSMNRSMSTRNMQLSGPVPAMGESGLSQSEANSLESGREDSVSHSCERLLVESHRKEKLIKYFSGKTSNDEESEQSCSYQSKKDSSASTVKDSKKGDDSNSLAAEDDVGKIVDAVLSKLDKACSQQRQRELERAQSTVEQFVSLLPAKLTLGKKKLESCARGQQRNLRKKKDPSKQAVVKRRLLPAWCSKTVKKEMVEAMERRQMSYLDQEELLFDFADTVKLVIKSKDVEEIKDGVLTVQKQLFDLKIVKTLGDFFHFVRNYLPLEFRYRSIPCSGWDDPIYASWVDDSDLDKPLF